MVKVKRLLMVSVDSIHAWGAEFEMISIPLFSMQWM